MDSQARAKTTDERLVSRARAGDASAYETLVDRHRDVVFRVASRIVGSSDAEDVAQDSFVRAYYRLGQFDGRGSFRSWILQITRSVALNSIRRRRPEPSAEIEALAASDGDVREVDRRPASLLESKERRERLEQKLGLLKDNHRTVLVLRDVEGMAYEEIAAIADMPIGSVKGRLHRARAEMIDLLRHNTYDWDLPRE